MRANQWTGPRPLAVQFWERVPNQPEDGCWEWAGMVQYKGYGTLSSQGRPVLAHRASWIVHFGPIPDGLWVLHHCDNPPCVNPAHLFLGTAADNTADMVAKGRQSRGERHGATVRGVPRRPRRPVDRGPICPNGHERAIHDRYQANKRLGHPTPYCGRCHADRQIARYYAGRAS